MRTSTSFAPTLMAMMSSAAESVQPGNILLVPISWCAVVGSPAQALGVTAIHINMFRDLTGAPSLLGLIPTQPKGLEHW